VFLLVCGTISSFCQAFMTFQNPMPPKTHKQDKLTPTLFRASGISIWISSQSVAFPAFTVLTATTNSAVMILFLSDCTPCVSDGVIGTVFKRHLKCSLNLTNKSTSLLSKEPYSSLVDVPTLILLQRKCRKLSQ